MPFLYLCGALRGESRVSARPRRMLRSSRPLLDAVRRAAARGVHIRWARGSRGRFGVQPRAQRHPAAAHEGRRQVRVCCGAACGYGLPGGQPQPGMSLGNGLQQGKGLGPLARPRGDRCVRLRFCAHPRLVALAPGEHGIQHGPHALAERCERVLHARRHLGVDGAADEAVCLHLA